MKVDALGLVPQEDIGTFIKIEGIMEALPDIKLDRLGGMADNEVVSCHMLGRAFERFLPVKCADGFYYRRGWRHSWLVTGSGNIVDHYPWGMIGGPLLVVADRFNPSFRLYHECKLGSLYKLGSLDEDEIFRLHTRQVIAAMEQTIKTLYPVMV